MLNAHSRLQGVNIEKKDWRDCIATYDKDTTFFYCDPPYIGVKPETYAPWTEKDLAELAGRLRGLAGRFILSFNDGPWVKKFLRGFRVKHFSRPRGIKTGKIYREILAMNFLPNA